MTPEQAVKRAICGWLEIQRNKGLCMFWLNESTGTWDVTRGIYRKKVSRWALKGIPDILGDWMGRPLAIEVKSAKGRLNPDQRVFLEVATKRGWIAFMARSVDDVIDVLTPERTKEIT